MKKIILSLASLALPACWLGAVLPQDLSVSSDITYVSKYMFRGLQFAEESFQPTVEVAVGDFYAGVWANLPTGLEESEINYYGGYGFAVPGLETIAFDLGLTVYHFPDTGANRSHEFFLGAAFELPQAPALSPSVYYYHDVDLETNVLEAAITYSHSLEGVGMPASLDLSVFGGAQDGAHHPDTESYNYYGASLELPYSLSEFSALTAGLHYTNAEKIADADHELYWSVGYSTSF